MYPALHRLEGMGLVRSSWSTASGRRRRMYELTAAGRKALGVERAGWLRFSQAVTAVMGP